MYKIGKHIFFLFLGMITLVVGIIAVAQTKWFKKELENSIRNLGEKNGFCVSIEGIEGSLPLEWKISNITLQKEDTLLLSIQNAKIRLAFLPLLRKQLVISYLKTDDAQLNLKSFPEVKSHQSPLEKIENTLLSLSSLPFDLSLRSFHIDRFKMTQADFTEEWSATGTFLIKKHGRKIAINVHLEDLQRDNKFSILVMGGRSKGQLEITRASLLSSLGRLEASGTLGETGELIQAKAILDIPELHALHSNLRGNIKLDVALTYQSLAVTSTSDHFMIGPLQMACVATQLGARKKGQEWYGTLETKANSTSSSLDEATLQTHFIYSPLLKTIQLTSIDFQAPSFFTGGNLELKLAPYSVTGTLNVEAHDLHALQPFFTKWHLAGQCGGSIHFSHTDSPGIALHLLGNDLQGSGIVVGQCTLEATLSHLLDSPEGNFEIEAERIYYEDIYLSSLAFSGVSDHQGWPLNLEAQGTWKYPFSLQTSMHYEKQSLGTTFILKKMEGNFFEQSLQIERPLNVSWGDGSLYVKDLAFKIGEGFLKGELEKNTKQLTLSLQGEKLPLSWLSIFTPYLALEGQSSLESYLVANEESLQGYFRLNLDRLQAQKRGESPLYAKGTLEAHLDATTLQIQGQLEASEEQMMLAHVSLPLNYQPHPFSVTIDQEHPLSGSFTIEGKLGEIFNYANTGSQEITGWIAGKILLFGTLNTPLLKGTLEIQQASYNNYLAGVDLRNLEATIRAENDRLVIEKMTARDPHEGTLEGEGEIALNINEYFPYVLTGRIDHFDAVSLDLVQAKLTGPLQFTGNLQKARLEGSLVVNAAEISIPKSLPANLPDLPFTFSEEPTRNPGLIPPQKIFPFAFDVSFESPSTLTFEGNGLTSTWGGHLHLHGVNMKLLASGALRLAKGQFQILGKTFLLQQGELTFNDKPGQEGFLSLTGTLNVQDATITAQLRGPLSSPQLSFYATPSLTTNEIFSLLLFNKRVSEIKPIQAIQLAHTVLTFYGHTGWNPVSQIGSGLNTLGIDTFDIIPSEEGLKQSSITIGKHFSFIRNMLVTLTQSLDSRRFMVEVDLGKGLLFQAENQSGADQSQQEGKFSLKWNKNY